MSLLALCYPEISENDYNWIQTIRSRYDKENMAIVEPHITVVFPVESVIRPEFVRHVFAIITKSNPINIVLNHFDMLWDKANSTGYLCLMPDVGRVELISLYNRLYTGILEYKKSFEEEIKPHMTVGVFGDKSEGLNIVKKLNSEPVSIMGKISSVSIADYNGKEVTDLNTVIFGS